MSGLDVKSNNDSNNLNTKWFVIVLCLIALTILGFYFANFHGGLSSDNDVWGTFGDYVGGILNPLIAAFAFYLIARTYELQKIELEATRKLLEISTEDSKNQIKLSALSSHLNSILMRIDSLKTERLALSQGIPIEPKDISKSLVDIYREAQLQNINIFRANFQKTGYTPEASRFIAIEHEIKILQKKASELEEKIELFYKDFGIK